MSHWGRVPGAASEARKSGLVDREACGERIGRGAGSGKRRILGSTGWVVVDFRARPGFRMGRGQRGVCSGREGGDFEFGLFGFRTLGLLGMNEGMNE